MKKYLTPNMYIEKLNVESVLTVSQDNKADNIVSDDDFNLLPKIIG